MKLTKLGIKGNIFKWIQNYLSDRKQCTFANGMVSSLLDITLTYGVPQRSILGSLFFIVYVNDMKHVLKNCKHLMYADDTVLYLTGDLQVCTDVVQKDLLDFKLWCNRVNLP